MVIKLAKHPRMHYTLASFFFANDHYHNHITTQYCPTIMLVI